MRSSALVMVLALLGLPSQAQENTLPGPLGKVGFDQHLGDTIPLQLPFVDASGADVLLGDFFGERPVVLALVYYDCPMLCTMVLNGLTTSLRAVDFDPGDEFEVVIVSFDASDTPQDAAERRDQSLGRYRRPGTEAGWHFLSGGEESIQRLTQAVGFSFTFDEASDQFAHAAGIMVATPEGRLARYFYGVEYPPRDLRLGLIEAAANGIGNPVDQLLLYCFQYDPSTGKYSAVVMNVVRLGAISTLAIMTLYFTLSWRRGRRLHST